MVESAFIIGATGKVGSTLAKQILRDDTNPTLHRNPTKIVGVASSTTFLYDEDGLSDKMVLEFVSKKREGNKYEDLFEVFRSSNITLNIIDVTASYEMLDMHTRIVRDTSHKIVTANKNPLISIAFHESFPTL